MDKCINRGEREVYNLLDPHEVRFLVTAGLDSTVNANNMATDPNGWMVIRTSVQYGSDIQTGIEGVMQTVREVPFDQRLSWPYKFSDADVRLAVGYLVRVHSQRRNR